MKLITPLIALLCLVPAAQAATAWEGLVTLNVTGPGMLSQFVNYSTHNGIVRVDLLGGDNGSRLVDSVKKEVIIIAPEGKTYARLPFAPAPAIDPTAQVEKLALTDPIQGHPTSHYTVKAGGMRAEVWLAENAELPTGGLLALYALEAAEVSGNLLAAGDLLIGDAAMNVAGRVLAVRLYL